jgi:hypothetical protein
LVESGPGERVSDLTNRPDQSGVVGTELDPQPPDVNVHRPGAAEVRDTPDGAKQLVAGEDPVRVL